MAVVHVSNNLSDNMMVFWDVTLCS